MSQLIHGGDLYSAASYYKISADDWIDLSTGINPVAYPFEAIPQKVFAQLPYLSPDFGRAVQSYYGNHEYISLSGSQELIQNLPQLLDKLPVILPAVGYQEHQNAWAKSKNTISLYDSLNYANAEEEIDTLIKQNPTQHLVIINPNNPSGLYINLKKLVDWSARLADGARLIVDEAFIDLQPKKSLLTLSALPENILVLRSCGKFFGLGGIRVGFLFGASQTLSKLGLPNNPWPINGIAHHILCRALRDRKWHTDNQQRIEKNSKLMLGLMGPLNLDLLSSQGLFLSYLGETDRLHALYETFARAGILFRLIPVNSSHSILRIGLLDSEDQYSISRVKNCIEHASKQSK